MPERQAGDVPPSPPPRSWLFIPGAAERFVAKLRTLEGSSAPDAVIFDLEDGVATGDLAAARERVGEIAAAPGGVPWLPATVAVRTHGVTHPAFAEDLATLGPGVSTLMLPKVGSAQEVERAAELLLEADHAHVGTVAIIESALGLEQVAAIAGSGVQGLAFGAEDFAADLGLAPWSLSGQVDSELAAGRQAVLDAARARIVTAAASAGLVWRIDTPTLQIGQGDGQVDSRGGRVEAEARRSRAMGFSGKFAIHPRHVVPLHRGFEPSPGEVAWARAVLASEASNAASDQQGASLTAGQMVDEAVFRQARAILALRCVDPGFEVEATAADGGGDAG